MPFYSQQIIRRDPPKHQAQIFSGPVLSQVVNSVPQTITFIGGVKGASETTGGVTASNVRKFTKLFFDYKTNTIHSRAVLTPLGNFGIDFVNYVIPESLEIPLARTAGDSFTLLKKTRINVTYLKNLPNVTFWGKGSLGFKSFTVDPGTYTLATRGLLPTLPQIGLNNQEVITFVSLRYIDDVPVGVITNNPNVFSTAFSQNVSSDYFTVTPVVP